MQEATASSGSDGTCGQEVNEVQLPNNQKSIMPAILEELLFARAATRKLIKSTDVLSNHDSSRSTARSYTVLVRVMEFRAFFNYVHNEFRN